jgi:hypothetical protein
MQLREKLLDKVNLPDDPGCQRLAKGVQYVNIFVDSRISDDGRRKELYQGSIFVHAPCASALKLCALARELAEDAFRPLNPCKVQEAIPPERSAEILSALKPKFIHHPKAKEYIQGMLVELGCDLEKTYFDVPRLRTAFPGDYLKSGIAYAFHPHRDTWYSAPFCQVNWWMPVYPITAENSMAIHPRYWGQPIRNGSSEYNYHRWNLESRQNAAQHVKSDTRVQPKPEEPVELDPQFRLICEPGGVYQFSAAQLHSTVPNSSGLTRYSIDFRTVHLDDVWTRSGAPNVDSACTGTTIGDYLKGTDFSHLPQDAIALYQDGTECVYDTSVGVPNRATGVGIQSADR